MMNQCPQCHVALPPGTTERVCPHCRTDLMAYQDPAATLATLVISLPPEPAAPRPAGDDRFFGNYELLEEVARGGMGVVFRARQKSLNRIVALKMIRGERLAQAEDVRRFYVEAQSAAQLHHPNIVAIHEVGECDGQHFYSMDLIEGRSLAQIARERPLPPKQAALYARKIAQAIHYAHSRQILHRDLKPANVLIDLHDEPQVTDFGLAKVMEAESGATLSGTIMGSPSYMPPEQASGRAREVGPCSDVYGLGALLYELLCGRPPFRAETPMETLRQVLEKDPPPPRLLNPRVPRDLETICLKCLEKSPERRFASALELAAELTRFLNDEPILARPVGPAARVLRWCRRKPALAAVGAAALLAVGVISVGSPIVAFRLDDARQKAEDGEAKAGKNLYAADMAVVQEAIADGRRTYARQLLEAHLPGKDHRDLRGWEWRYFWQQNRSDEEATLTRHATEVRSVRVSPRGNWVLSADLAGNVKLWDVTLATNVLTVNGAGNLLAFSPDEAFFYVAKRAPGIRVWKLADLKEQRPRLATTGRVQALECDPESGRLLAVGDGTMNVIDPASGLTLAEHAVPSGSEVTVSSDGRWVAVCADNQTVQLWDQRNRSVRSLDTGHVFAGGHAVRMAFSPDGATLFTTAALITGGNFRVQAWETATGVRRTDYGAHKDYIMGLAVSPDGQLVATVGYDQEIDVRETSQWQPINPPFKIKDKSAAIGFFPGSTRLISGDTVGRVNQFTLVTRLHRLELPREATSALLDEKLGCASPDYSTLVLLRPDGAGWLVDTRESRIASEFQLPWSDVVKVAATTNAGLLACARADGILILFDRVRQTRLAEFELEASRPATRLAFAPDGRWLAVANGLRALQLVDVAARREIPGWRAKVQKVAAVRFSPDSRQLACGHEGGKITLWDVGSGARLLELPGHTYGMNHLAFSPDGLRLASTGWDSRARVWDLVAGREIVAFHGSRSSFYRVAFSPDGSRLLLSEWGDAFLFDIAAQRQVALLKSFLPVFLDDDTVLGLNANELRHYRAPRLAEVDAEVAARKP